MKTNDSEKAEIADSFSELITTTLFGFLLANSKMRTISISELDITQEEIDEITELTQIVNEIGDEYFIIDNGVIHINENLNNCIKRYLFDELIWLISPQGEIYSSLPVTVLGEKRFIEEYPLIDVSKKNDSYYNAYVKRYVTQDAYSQDTLELFDCITEKLINLQTKTPSFTDSILISKLERILLARHYSWLNFLSDLANGKLQPNDDLSGYFHNKRNLKLYIMCTTLLNVPSLITKKGGTYVVSSAFFENKMTILPYIINSIEFVYMPDKMKHSLIYSCFFI